MTNPIMANIFSSFRDYLSSEQDTREEIRVVVKEIDKCTIEILTVLQIIHQDTASTDIIHACMKARGLFEEIRKNFSKLAMIVPKGEYYRYNDHWRFVTQRLCFLAALIIFLEVGVLISKDTAAEIIGVKSDANEGFHLDLEDYLIGLLQLASELSRFAVNAVTKGDYNRPLQISKFVTELNAGFRLLNMKNDSLRKRFDALKYDVKKIEEVVYDLSIRGLKPGQLVPDDSKQEIKEN
ncbi:translin [Agrilus planipennis]|uniref:Translin n=1 Tax=Agrilus planipennis TaxID=224129 RepID=A0A1W4XBM6_AGRPL|nr:translin [Agrilus planipennis]